MTDAPTINPDRTDAAYEAGRSATSQKWLLGVVGIVSILAGVIAIAMPLLGSLTAAYVMGGALILSGLAGLFTAFRRREGWSIAAAFAVSVLSLVLGIAIFLQPLAGLFALTSLIIAWFAASGALRCYYGARMMGEGGGWMVAGGALSILVAAMLWASLPFSAIWVPGLLLGLDLMLWGALMITLAVRLTEHPAPLHVDHGALQTQGHDHD